MALFLSVDCMANSIENKRRVMESHIFGDLPSENKPRRNFQNENYDPPVRNREEGYFYSPESPKYTNMNPAYGDYHIAPKGNSKLKFMSTQVVAPSVYQYDGTRRDTSVAPLSKFPEFTLESTPITETYQFPVKPLSAQPYKSQKKLSFAIGSEIKKMQEEIKTDSEVFSNRIRMIIHPVTKL